MVKTETPEEVKKLLIEVVKGSSGTGNMRKGVNEVTKAIERGKALLVVIAEDVDPPEIITHIPKICAEKGIPYSYVSSKQDLGNASGLHVSTTSVAIVDAGNAKEALADVLKRLPKPAPAKAKGEA